MNADELMDQAIKAAKVSSEQVKRKTNSFAKADAEKIRKVTELTTGYLEAMITLSWKDEGKEAIRSSLASSLQIIEEISKKALEKTAETKDYRKTGSEVKKFYGRLNSILKKIDFAALEQ